jgi:hypothetical protein
MIQISHTTIAEWSAEKARKTVHEDVLSFVTTVELVPLRARLAKSARYRRYSITPRPGSGAAHRYSGWPYGDAAYGAPSGRCLLAAASPKAHGL